MLDEGEGKQVIEHAHVGVHGAYHLGPKLYDPIKRMCYYWPTIVHDCIQHAKRYGACQFYVNFIHQPPEPLHLTISSWPFKVWRLDVVRPFTLKSSTAYLYIWWPLIISLNGHG